jgi:acetyl-CoA carboxylase carboxyl transferase beta subunit
MNPFSKRKEQLMYLRTTQKKRTVISKKDVAESLFAKCTKCGATYPKAALTKTFYVCPDCGYHFKISAYYRLSMILDSGSFKELNPRIVGNDPLNFPEYEEKLKALQDSTGLSEGAVSAVGKIDGKRVVVAALDSRFLMGSMGSAVGEKITRAIEYATQNKLPLIIFSASGGARMQEGIISLMQMAKTSAALGRHSKAGLLYISVLTHPTTGGVTASFASLGDIILAEPGALIGFAGPRVIEQTINQKLPEGFQRSEYLKGHGFVDSIVPRGQLRQALSLLLTFHEKKVR